MKNVKVYETELNHYSDTLTNDQVLECVNLKTMFKIFR